MVYKNYFHIGVAVDTSHGLMVPKIRDVDKLGVKEISQQLRTVSKLCRELKIEKKEFFGGSMTISSLGGIGGVTFFTPIINPPEVSILGVGKSYEKVLKIDGQFVSKKILIKIEFGVLLFISSKETIEVEIFVLASIIFLLIISIPFA